MQNIPSLFRSKRFWSATIGVMIMTIGAFVPAIEISAEMYTEAIINLVGLLMGGYIVEDAIKAYKGTK